MIWSLLALGGIAFWCATGLFVLLAIWLVAEEHFGRSLLALAGYVLVISLFGDLWSWRPDPALLYIGIPAYFAMGIGWGIVKWYLRLRRKAEEYKECRRDWLVAYGVLDATLDTPIPDSLAKKAACLIQQDDFDARRNKGLIIGWMAMWPFSMAWAAIDEPWRRIYHALANLFQRIADHVKAKAGIDKDINLLNTANKK